jgi:hypothetical protein
VEFKDFDYGMCNGKVTDTHNTPTDRVYSVVLVKCESKYGHQGYEFLINEKNMNPSNNCKGTK